MRLEKLAKLAFRFPNNVQPLERRLESGLLDGRKRQSGYNVSFSERHTRRSWYPNIQNKRLFSDSLQDFVKMKVSTKALRSIDRMGGLDNYLMKSSDDKLGLYGRALRRSVIDKRLEKTEENANV
ncbi:hypothetical protein E3Q22_00025 [Wallemia mellicola]|uniref:Large ribosomal subunit protein bL28c n=2 Tax=Wallemia mellicola TaxID=1708541 RepID=A0A4T0RAR7_9BASI|nr:hypothetical protein E3Q24_00311 [Wallemia mellicola]TIB79610.1 hypothetical protein E3Q23_00021 [Wallemia mellicola]TIB82733.1 hypothetical protein E3Q22_00025 [Wallemia mellicola]TIB99920.1 hypothetical protein E3Q17_02397 [Wallemia mellicola]TIC11060.1 hypothetical protein E3Q14_02476 [Wallemia mellicola]